MMNLPFKDHDRRAHCFGISQNYEVTLFVLQKERKKKKKQEKIKETKKKESISFSVGEIRMMRAIMVG